MGLARQLLPAGSVPTIQDTAYHTRYGDKVGTMLASTNFNKIKNSLAFHAIRDTLKT